MNYLYFFNLQQNPSKTFEDDKVCLVYNNCVVGTMNVLARVSVYGQTIVTEFDSPCDNNTASFLFKSNDRNCDGKPLGYKFNVLNPDECDSTSLESMDNYTSNKKKKKEHKLSCSPCRVGSGAKIIGTRNCPKVEDEICHNRRSAPIQTSRGSKEPCGKAVVLKVN